MLSVFSSLKSFLKTKQVRTEGISFRLHSNVTVLFLLSASLLLSARQYFGDPIHCIQKDVSRIRALETFCWVHATFILPDAWNATVGVQVPHPGIDRHIQGQRKVYHGYYQWVTLVLLMQGIMFYFPKYLWKSWEKGKIEALTMDLHDPILTSEQANKSISLLVNSLKSHWGYNGYFLRSYIICEVLSLVNLIVQIFMLDEFLDNAFTTFGLKVIQWSEWEQEYRNDPLVRVFPRMTKCQFYDFGSSGDVQRMDALCLLPLNILNEKIFIFLWFWFTFLCIVTSISILFKLLVAAMPMFRYCVIVLQTARVNKGHLDEVLLKASIADWFVLYLLANNIHTVHYQKVVSELANTLSCNGFISTRNSSFEGSRKFSSGEFV